MTERVVAEISEVASGRARDLSLEFKWCSECVINLLCEVPKG